MSDGNREELNGIIRKFAASGWELIDAPSQAWLAGQGHAEDLILAIEQADAACGNCGCEFDPLYKRALQLKEIIRQGV